MRGYPQGTAWLIAPRLTERKQVVAARFRRPLALAPQGRSGDVSTLEAGWNFVQYLPDLGPVEVPRPDRDADRRARHEPGRARRLVLRGGQRHAVHRQPHGRRQRRRGALHGARAGITISFSGHDVRHADGRQLQRVGLIPDIEVKPTIEGIRAGRDEVLEKALDHLGVPDAKLSNVGEAR